VKTLIHWRTVRCPHESPRDRFKAPEQLDHFHLVGIVDGKTKTTSRVVRSEGRDVWTKAGTHYHLGPVAPDFAAWLMENGLAIDDADPIKLIPRAS